MLNIQYFPKLVIDVVDFRWLIPSFQDCLQVELRNESFSAGSQYLHQVHAHFHVVH